MTAERTWEISDIDGSNRRTVTLAQFRAEVAAAKGEGRGHLQRSQEVGAEMSPEMPIMPTTGIIHVYGGDFRSNRLGPRWICSKFNPAKPLTGLALRLLKVSNAWWKRP